MFSPSRIRVFDPHLQRLLVLPLHEGVRCGVIKGDFYVVVPSLFASLEIDGDDVRNAIWVLRVRGEDEDRGELLVVAKVMKEMKSLVWYYLGFEMREKELAIRVRWGESRFWLGIFFARTVAIERAWLRCVMKVDGGSAIRNKGGAMFAHGGLIARDDEHVVMLMVAWWPCGGTLHEP
ncbi:hypothetical protein V8G54_017896 [Vigna mungo]|uniref:Uncharacterized protein n=1 Tax=Vigna mungo TaxID=3915 RepID=A0AAQ3N7Y9_VIGMU